MRFIPNSEFLIPNSVVPAIILAIATAPPAFTQGPEEYAQVVEEYRIGDAGTAVRRLARWPDQDTSDAVRHWVKQLRPEQLVAALMLHTELAHAILDCGNCSRERWTKCARGISSPTRRAAWTPPVGMRESGPEERPRRHHRPARLFSIESGLNRGPASLDATRTWGHHLAGKGARP